MKKIILSTIIFIIIAGATNAITITPTTWSVDYMIGETNPSKAFTFSNDENVSKTITVTESGEIGDWINASTNTITINPSTTKDITFIIQVPQETLGGVYIGYITYDSSSVPIIITVIESTSVSTSCRLTPLITNYITSIKSNTPPFTKRFSVTVSKHCTEAVDIKAPIIVGVTETSEGSKPISLTGALTLGLKEPGNEAVFDIEFDVGGLQSGTYNPTVIIPGYYKGDKIQTTIDFAVTITGSLSPIRDGIRPPTYQVPVQVKRGEDFEIKVIDLDPNLQPQLFFNQVLIGASVDRRDESWTWTGHINQTGTFEISITSMFSGGQIGGVHTSKIMVVENLGQATGNLTFELFPSEDNILSGDEVSILIRDGRGNIVDDALIYINGVRSDNKKILEVEQGRLYQLSATHPNFATVDKILQLANKELNIIVNPSDPEQGEMIMVSVTDKIVGGIVQNFTILYDNLAVPASFPVGLMGPHTIKTEAPNYNPTTLNINVSTQTTIVYQPEKLKRKKNATLTVSKPTSWSVRWNNKNEKKPDQKLVASGVGETITFTPEKNGEYQIIVRGKLIKIYQVKGFQISWSWYYLTPLLIIIILIIIIKIASGGSTGGRRVGYGTTPTSGGGSVITPI